MGKVEQIPITSFRCYNLQKMKNAKSLTLLKTKSVVV